MSNNLANNLKKLRKDNNLSQEQLADKLGVSRQAISKWESGSAYPEMEKIIQICQLFDININDLLNNDIKEVKNEKEVKNNINKYLDDFLNFISKTINMFSSFSFKMKVKCLFEQFIVISVIILLFMIINSILTGIFSNIISFLPSSIHSVMYNLFDGVLGILFTIIGVVICIHLFKVRYLDYYELIDNKVAINNEDNKNIDINNKERIVIRDNNNFGYRIIDGLFKISLFIIKAFILLAIIVLSGLLIFVLSMVICSLLIINSGLFFLGILLGLLGIVGIIVIIILILSNFVFNRKSNKKGIIWTFISSIFMIGIGAGVLLIGLLDFKIIDNIEDGLLVSKTFEVDMKNNLIIDDYYFDDIQYINEEIDNIRIEYSVNKYCKSSYEVYDDDEFSNLNIISYCDNPIELIKVAIGYINDKTIANISNEVVNVKVYGRLDNIELIKNNYQKYLNR